jgi:hypothetical protein
MPDRRMHRGPHPEDTRLFAAETLPILRKAADDLCWLLSRGYPHDSTLKLVGDRYALLARQRIALSRCCCSDTVAAQRQKCQLRVEHLAGTVLWLDGYNVLTTIEAALAGGVILAARDGAYRDLASMHGSYRKVVETIPALELLGQVLAAFGIAECRWLLDRPVSNSGRLKTIIQRLAADHGWPWPVDLVADPDAVLAQVGGNPLSRQRIVVATADSAILDSGPAWFNLARETVARGVPDAWVLELMAR